MLNGAYKNRGDDWSVSLPNAADRASRSHSFSSVAWYQRASKMRTAETIVSVVRRAPEAAASLSIGVLC